MSDLSITLIQPDLLWENKKANLEMLEKLIQSSPEHKEIVVLPEMFSTGFSMRPSEMAEKMDGPGMEWMDRVSRTNNIILSGSLIIEEEGKYYNRLIWMQPDGKYACYDKRHLFAFGGEDQHYSAGNKRLIVSAKGWRINVQICYDLRFPVWSRQSPGGSSDPTFNLPEYDLLIYVANWPEKRKVAWKTLLQARAIENQCFIAGVNRVGTDGNNIYHSGDSMIIDPLGEILYEKQNSPGVHTELLEMEKLAEIRSKFPFLKDADSFNISH